MSGAISGPPGILIDLPGYRIWSGGEAVPLTPKERQLLERLARTPGAVVPRGELMAQVGKRRSRTVDVYVCRLRRKLQDQEGAFIQTVRKVGYRLNPPEVSAGQPAA